MSFRVSLLTFLLFAAFGGLRPNLATTDGHSTTMSNAGSSAIIAYWQTVLPHSTMPSAIRNLLTPSNAEAKVDNPYLPISAFYGKEANNWNSAIFYGKGKNGGNPYLPISAFYGKEAKNLNPAIFYERRTNRGSPLPISAFYGKEAKNLNPAIQKGANGGNPYLPISSFYGKEVKNLNPAIFYEKGTNRFNPLPISTLYGKEVKNLNPAIQKRTNGGNPYLPISAFYGKEAKNLNPTTLYGKGTNEENLLPISAFYGKEAKKLNPAILKGKNGGNPYLPILTFYGKEAKNLNRAIFYGKGTNGPVHVPVTNMADADHRHHVHEHRHIDGGHDHFDLMRNTSGFLFLEDALTPGAKVAPYIDPASSPGAPLLPRDVADSIPMSTKSFTAILRMFAPVSRAMAESIWNSLELCEHPRPIKGEKRGCVTSVESMVDFAASVLGTSDLRALSSPSVPAEGRAGSKVYTVVAARAVTSPGDTMTCHGIPFPYKVFLCHALVPTKVYSLTVESDGGGGKEKIEDALVVCHLNTAEFDPMKMPPHVKPGDAPVCHFLNNDDVLWAPAATTLSGTQGAADDDVVAAQ